MTDYNLPDMELLLSEDNSGFKVFQPDKNYLVLGRSNKEDHSIFMNLAEDDSINILQRPSGGEAVLLTPNMAVISIKMPLIKGQKPNFYFKHANSLITRCLEEMGINNIHSKGISDLSIGNKKILGSAIYRTQNSMFYHAVLNINEDIKLISKYLKHPKREPDYRKGRSHSAFITSLKDESHTINYDVLQICLENTLNSSFFSIFAL